MGLDGYLFRRPKTPKLKMAAKLADEKEEQLAYWRKAYDINEMFLSYASPELSTERGFDLNCQGIILTEDDLKNISDWTKEQLKEGIKEGDSDTMLELNADLRELRDAIEKALETDFNNYEVYYYAWW